MKRLGVISDTHGLLRQEVVDVLKDCQGILHAGDIGTDDVLKQLRQIAPVFAVRGNADGNLAESLPLTMDETFEGVRILAAHQRKKISSHAKDVNVILTGHTHRYREVQEKGVTYLNPGSCGPERHGSPVSMAVLTIRNGTFLIEKIIISSGESLSEARSVTKDKVRLVIKEISGKRSIEQIAQKSGLSVEMTETIVRLYLTNGGRTLSTSVES